MRVPTADNVCYYHNINALSYSPCGLAQKSTCKMHEPRQVDWQDALGSLRDFFVRACLSLHAPDSSSNSGKIRAARSFGCDFSRTRVADDRVARFGAVFFAFDVVVNPSSNPGDPPASKPASAQPFGESARKLRLLLVEDHVDTAQILGRLLRKMGHHVAIAGTVAAALQEADELFRTGGIDLVISDVGLPDGTGLEVMRTLFAKYHVRGISLSGFGMDSDIAQSKAAGFSRHLIKPIDVGVLHKSISALDWD